MSSQAYQLRSQIKSRIVDQVAGLDAADVIIDRQFDILGAIDTAVAIASNGVAVTILPANARHVDPRSDGLIFDATITLATWTMPVLAGDLDAQPEEEIHEDILAALHGYRVAVLDNDSRRCWQRLSVTGFGEVDDPQYLRRNTTIAAEFTGVN